MSRKSLFLLLALPFILAACSKQKMPPVPTTAGEESPCSALAPWGFPQATALPDTESTKKSRRKDQNTIGFVCRKGMYALGYDQALRVPRWSIEIVSPKNWQGDPKKVRKDWRPDPLVPQPYNVAVSDYSNEITQGKVVVNSMVSYKNFANDESAIGRTFYLSNTAPAIKKDDQPGAWSRLEDQVVAWSLHKQDLLVVSGPIFAGGSPLGWTGHKQAQRRGDQERGVIAVPTHFYKVVVDLDKKSAIAFVIPNDDSAASLLPSMAKRVQDVERAAAIQFFPSLSPEDRAQIVDRVVVEEWPLN